jgi:hypothetical protein
MTQLLLHREGKGLCHSLEGRRVHAGTTLELLRGDGLWVRGRYEWTFHEGSAPSLYTSNGVISLEPRSELRWPPRS